MGKFIDFYLPYKDKEGQIVSNDKQAKQILEKTRALVAAGAKGVAITYSANYGQTVKILKTYEDGKWDTQTSGSNQAAVMYAMEKLLAHDYADLQKTQQIAPITTMTYTDYGGKTQQEVVEADLQHIKDLLDNGWDVLGWINQDSKPNYAVGGGVAKKTMPPEIGVLIQTTLKEYAVLYGDCN